MFQILPVPLHGVSGLRGLHFDGSSVPGQVHQRSRSTRSTDVFARTASSQNQSYKTLKIISFYKIRKLKK